MTFNSIHFIVNPVSGKGKGKEVIQEIKEIFIDYNIKIKITQKKNDAYEFALKSIEENAGLIVSCGGDGTLNEVASAMVGKETPIAIVPIGSGNGLARHLKVPLQHGKALKFIEKSQRKIEKIDCGKINNHYFFSNAGIGFDAEVIDIYASQKQRQLLGYIKCVILGVFKFKPLKISLISRQMAYNGKIMMLNISNSNCMGYGFSITPEASLHDGQFDVNVIKKCNWFTFSWIGLGFIFRSNLSSKRKQFNTDKLAIEADSSIIQIDGESIALESKHLNISMIPQSLNVLVG